MFYRSQSRHSSVTRTYLLDRMLLTPDLPPYRERSSDSSVQASYSTATKVMSLGKLRYQFIFFFIHFQERDGDMKILIGEVNNFCQLILS